MTQVAWGPREPPLAATGVAGEGEAARALAKRLLARDPDALVRLRGVTGKGLIVVLGDTGELPWAPGARYLGRDPGAPSLWLPTTLAPSVAAALLERALLVPPRKGPHAVLLSPPRLVPLAEARPVTSPRLEAFLAEAT